MRGRRTGSGDGKCIAESPKQNSKRFNFITKTIHFAHLVVLFIYEDGGREEKDEDEKDKDKVRG